MSNKDTERSGNNPDRQRTSRSLPRKISSNPQVLYLQSVETQTRRLAHHISQMRGRAAGMGVRGDMMVQVEAGLARQTRDTLEDIERLYREMKILKMHLEQ